MPAQSHAPSRPWRWWNERPDDQGPSTRLGSGSIPSEGNVELHISHFMWSQRICGAEAIDAVTSGGSPVRLHITFRALPCSSSTASRSRSTPRGTRGARKPLQSLPTQPEESLTLPVRPSQAVAQDRRAPERYVKQNRALAGATGRASTSCGNRTSRVHIFSGFT